MSRWAVKDHVVALLRHGVKESLNRVFESGMWKKKKEPSPLNESDQKARDPA